MPFDITQLDSNTIIFGGLTLGLMGMIWVIRYAIVAFKDTLETVTEKHTETDKLYFNHTNTVIERNTAAWVDNTRSNQALVSLIEGKKKKSK